MAMSIDESWRYNLVGRIDSFAIELDLILGPSYVIPIDKHIFDRKRHVIVGVKCKHTTTSDKKYHFGPYACESLN